MTSVTAILLNWNGRPYLGDALRSLHHQTEPADHIWLVDNASTDDSLAFVAANFPDVTILPLPENGGFSAGNNAALRKVTTDVAVLLNPDIILDPGCLAALRRPFVDDPTIGIAGCKLVEPDGHTIQHAGGMITRPLGLADYHGLGEMDAGQHDGRRDVDYVVGAALAVRRAVWEQIGLLDEGYFLYFEDVDFCVRARRAGWRVVVEPAARLVHLESALSGRGTPFYLRHMHHGRWRTLLKHADITAILDATAPAEREWLATRSFIERRAAVRAYRAAWAQWAAIATHRQLPAERRAAVSDLLRSLMQEAWPASLPHLPAPPSVATLQSAAVVRERPFGSALPLVGPLIAFIRAGWHRVADRPYLRPQLAAQNQFNSLVAEQVARLDAALAAEAAGLDALEAVWLDRLLKPPPDPAAHHARRHALRTAHHHLRDLNLSPDE